MLQIQILKAAGEEQAAGTGGKETKRSAGAEAQREECATEKLRLDKAGGKAASVRKTKQCKLSFKAGQSVTLASNYFNFFPPISFQDTRHQEFEKKSELLLSVLAVIPFSF